GPHVGGSAHGTSRRNGRIATQLSWRRLTVPFGSSLRTPCARSRRGYAMHPSGALMSGNSRTAAIAVRDNISVTQRPADPHPASVAIDVEGTTYCASVLPWRSCGTGAPWRGRNVAAKTEPTTQTLIKDLPPGNTVWGGDWN